MANEFEWQGPEVRLQDVILMDYACQSVSNGPKLGGPLQCPDPSMPGQSTIEQIWADNPRMTPTVLSVGRFNDQASWWVDKRRSGQGSALRNIFQQQALKFPKNAVPGRVAAIGFSQGCSGIKELLNGAEDVDRLDFVYACDGMHGALGPDGTVTPESIEPWVNFGVKAASGDKMMVVTHTEIVPANRIKNNVAGTEETAAKFLELVRQRLGYKEIAPRMLPKGLIGDPSFAPTPAGGSWPGWSNSLSQKATIPGWPVKYYKIIGNLIVVGFNAMSPEEAAKGNTPANSTAAHIFQDWWVKDQVLREVLGCRWAAKCSADQINPEVMTTKSMTSSSQVPLVSNRKFPSVMYAPPTPKVAVAGFGGLGATEGACILEGVFSNLMSSSDMDSARTMAAFKMAAMGVGGAVGAFLLIRSLMNRR